MSDHCPMLLILQLTNDKDAMDLLCVDHAQELWGTLHEDLLNPILTVVMQSRASELLCARLLCTPCRHKCTTGCSKFVALLSHARSGSFANTM